MDNLSLDKVIRNMYDNRVTFIRSKNIELEREYFTKYSNQIPMSDFLHGLSYEDNFESFKRIVKNGNEHEISQIFTLLQEYFLFSYGHDLMFKKKLEADIFTAVPMEDFIYPKLVEAIKEKYNDLSVFRKNPNLEENLKGIDKLIYTYTELQSLLYLLYCNDFLFPNGWEGICPDTYADVLDILNKSGMTIGDFLHALIDFKCKTMNEILSEIEEPKLKQDYLKKVEKLQKQKHEETKTFAHIGLPITYFLDHNFEDFMIGKYSKPSILDSDKPQQSRKIILK